MQLAELACEAVVGHDGPRNVEGRVQAVRDIQQEGVGAGCVRLAWRALGTHSTTSTFNAVVHGQTDHMHDMWPLRIAACALHHEDPGSRLHSVSADPAFRALLVYLLPAAAARGPPLLSVQVHSIGQHTQEQKVVVDMPPQQPPVLVQP